MAVSLSMGVGPVGEGADAEGEALSRVRPSERQLAWQDLEMYAFVHFGMNTATDREWGLGDEDPALFDPERLDVDQWVRTFVAAGMRGAILTAKHHDGFCLWPTATTQHSVAASPWAGGRGDVVALVADAARRHGLRFGVYLSPWDRSHPAYGSGAAYDDVFVEQLRELLTGYGEVFSVWFDGACGEGPDGRVQAYDWDRYHAVVRELQPGAVISVCGPDVRWCGNEAGRTRADEWSAVPAALREVERIADASQHVDDGEFSRSVTSHEEDLGSREALRAWGGEVVWYPAEVNTSTRPGWFYHRSEDGAVRSADELFDLWAASVGGNACFLLNVPPDPSGRLAAPDVAALEGLGRRVAGFRSRVLPAVATASSGELDGDALGSFSPPGPVAWSPDAADRAPWVRLELGGVHRLQAVVLGEDVSQGQRVESVRVTGHLRGESRELAACRAVGRLRVLRLDDDGEAHGGEVDAVTVTVEASRSVPLLSTAALVGRAPSR